MEKFYTKKPIPVKASQWFKQGDHPCDHQPIGYENPSTECLRRYQDYLMTEGAVVKRFKVKPESRGNQCTHCDKLIVDHGWIDTLEGGHRVCPGDFIITGVRGERYPCKPDIFYETYEVLYAKNPGRDLQL